MKSDVLANNVVSACLHDAQGMNNETYLPIIILIRDEVGLNQGQLVPRV